MSWTSRMIRYYFNKSDCARDAGLTTPDDVVRYDDITYGKNKKWQVLDVYRPKSKDCAFEALPVIISVHGGGWVYGSKEVYQFYCMSLAQRGFAVVNFTYRLAPEFKFPAAVEDTDAVFHWVRSHAKEYGFDVDNIFGVGDSAGGHLLCLYSAMCTNPDYEKKLGFLPDDDRKPPRAVALNCGVYQIDLGPSGRKNDKRLMRDVLKHHGNKDEIECINPLPYITENFPATFIMTANHDSTVDAVQAQMLLARLRELRCDYTFRVYGTEEKPLDHVFHCNVRLEAAADCNTDECAFFHNHLE